MRRFLATAAWAVCAAGCQCGPRECWGDCSLPGSIVMGMRDDRGEFVEVKDDDAVDLTLPVQGGFILFVTARVTNIEKRGAVLLGQVRHPDTGALVAEEERRVDFPVGVAGGYGLSDLSITSQVANIAVCPNYLARDIVGQEWVVDVTVTDSRRMPVKASRRVVPSCRQTEASVKTQCQCECLGCFALGKCMGPKALAGCDGG